MKKIFLFSTDKIQLSHFYISRVERLEDKSLHGCYHAILLENYLTYDRIWQEHISKATSKPLLYVLSRGGIRCQSYRFEATEVSSIWQGFKGRD